MRRPLWETSQVLPINIYDANKRIVIKVLNVYVADNMVDFTHLHEFAEGYPTLLLGDHNAFHDKLSNNASKLPNKNGRKLVSSLGSSHSIVTILNGPAPMHIQGKS